MPIILKRPLALADLIDIWTYIAEDNIRAADRFAGEIDRKFKLLAQRPNSGRVRPELGQLIRSMTIGQYVIFYMPIGNGIEVVRVLHGARDIGSIFQEE